MARPSSYRPEYVDLVMKLSRLGLTDDQMADVIGVARSTFAKWKGEHPEFSDALKQGKSIADANVADRLYQRAMGYSHPAVKILAVAVGNNGGSEVQEVPYVEHYPPDTTAAIFWLKNRRPDLWRDRVQNEHSGPNGGPQQHEHTIRRVIVDPRNSDA